MSSSSSTIRARPTATSKSSTMTSESSAISSGQNVAAYGSTPVGIFSIKPSDETSNTSTTTTSTASTTRNNSSKKDTLSRTCTLDELPEWMHDNPAILTGYRRETFSYKKCIDSLWFLHNESGKT
ncbi:hypothetical protein BGZ49_008279 [Haplosporangium sp. Z 27]|nr:hypothetical protein BGZ49_008279 [Haplosporangium sp. Z 27]